MLFTNKSFHVFQASSLEERMQEIRKEIQPIFQQIGEKVCPFFTEKLDTPFYLHIAQHRRRSVYPPEETWAAFGPNKRGYKMDAHFQIGITREYAFVWLSVIDQPKNQQQIARCWSEKPALFETLPQDFVLSGSYAIWLSADPRMARCSRAADYCKKSELQIGKVYLKDQISTLTMEQLLADYRLLLPLYRNREELPILNQEGN